MTTSNTRPTNTHEGNKDHLQTLRCVEKLAFRSSTTKYTTARSTKDVREKRKITTNNTRPTNTRQHETLKMCGEAFISDEYDKVHDNDEHKRNNKEYKPIAS